MAEQRRNTRTPRTAAKAKPVDEYGHLQPVVWVAGYLAAYGASVLFERSPYEGVVGTTGGVLKKLHTQIRFCFWGFGYE